jgi:hypothetical protein
MGLTTLPCKKKIVEKPPRNSTRFCGGGQGLSWAVELRKEELQCFESLDSYVYSYGPKCLIFVFMKFSLGRFECL